MTEAIGKMLVVSAHGYAFCLAWQGDKVMHDYVTEAYSVDDSFALENVDHASLADGVFIGDLRIKDDGPGDWPGSREYVLQFTNPSPVTKAEWLDHCNNAWPWTPFVDAVDR